MGVIGASTGLSSVQIRGESAQSSKLLRIDNYARTAATNSRRRRVWSEYWKVVEAHDYVIFTLNRSMVQCALGTVNQLRDIEVRSRKI
jgi:hypothetical protein